jgi:hypothetical protein
MFARPLQCGQLSIPRRIPTGGFAPVTAVFPRVLQYRQVSVFRRKRARPPVPRTAVFMGVLHNVIMSPSRRGGARPGIPLAAAVLDSPRENVQVTVGRGRLARVAIPRAVECVTQPLQNG